MHMVHALKAVSLLEVVFQPMMNILLHRYVYSVTRCSEEHLLTNRITRKLTLGECRSHVSRTTICDPRLRTCFFHVALKILSNFFCHCSALFFRDFFVRRRIFMDKTIFSVWKACFGFPDSQVSLTIFG